MRDRPPETDHPAEPDDPAALAALVQRWTALHEEFGDAAERIAAAATRPHSPAERDDILTSACSVLDRIAELAGLVDSAAQAKRDADVMAQVDVIATAAARLAALIRDNHETAPLAPHETSSSLFLAAETATLAARCVLVLARRALDPTRSRRPLAGRAAVTVARGADWTARAAGWAEFTHLWPLPLAAAVAGLAALVAALAHVLLRRPDHIGLDLAHAGVNALVQHLSVLAPLVAVITTLRRARTHPPRHPEGPAPRTTRPT